MQSIAPLRKVITKEPKQPMPLYAPSSSSKCEDNIGMLAGYTKRYYRNQTTGRPNQVFVCSTCGAQRPKISKMTKHLNVHKKGKKQRGSVQSKIEPKPIIKLPTMSTLFPIAGEQQ